MPSTNNRQASIDSRRIALEREVTIRVARFDSFVTEYSTNISTTGMFIVSEKPYAPGTTFSFEFSVADDWKLIRGKAQVVWTRYRDEDKTRPAGMGVRFVELDAQSRRLIRWIVEKHIREGGKPFELDELRNVIDEALGDVIDQDDSASAIPEQTVSSTSAPRSARPKARRPPGKKARSNERNVFPLMVTAAVIVIGLVFLFWLTEWIPVGGTGSETVAVAAQAGGEEAGADPSETVEPVTNGPAAGAESAAAPIVADPEPRSSGAAPLGSAYAGVRDTLGGWSSAWSAQDVDGYLAAYSRRFRPQGSSRGAWAAQRRERLAAPEYIKVSISQLDIVRVQDDLVRATFFQSYRSDRYSDSVMKVVELVWEDGAWKILSERTG